MIETALQEVDELIVVIYETTVTPIPLHIRANGFDDYTRQSGSSKLGTDRMGIRMTGSMRFGKNSISSVY